MNIAVSNGNQIELLTSNGNKVDSIRYSSASALVYDSIHTDLYVSDTSHKNLSIFRVHVNKDGKSGPLQPVVVQSNTNFIGGLAFDPVTSSIFWTTGREKTIMRAHLNENKTELAIGNVLHKFDDSIPHGIAVDSCKGNLYWTNRNIGKSSIESSGLNGTHKTVVISEQLFKPKAITISQSDRHIYWVDEKPGYEFTIERCALDGSNRVIIIKDEHNQPLSLAVSSNKLYWTDSAYSTVWSVELSSSEIPNNKELFSVKKYEEHVGDVVTAHQDRQLDESTCKNMIELRSKVSTAVKVTSGICLHGLSTQTGRCSCNYGYTGTHCEISLCRNYCLNGGECSLDFHGAPKCICPQFFTGVRCDIDLCRNKCLNGGNCSITPSGTSAECHCKSGYVGDRCQLPSQICDHYCSTVATTPQFDRTTASQCGCLTLAVQAPNATSSYLKKNENKKWLDWSLGATCLVLLSICLVLSVIVFKLKGRPRLIRRYQVNPSTMKKSGRGSPADCEIAIENCCNMNICETPCYEPEFRAPGRNSKSKKEEKCGLLPNMEVQPLDNTSNDLF